jgi:hypothetical protein
MELKWKYLDELYREKYFDKDVPPVYLKADADKVIAEKDAKILALDAEVFKEKHHAKLFFDERNYAETQLRRQKYKRCLAMALLALEKRETYKAEYEEWCLKWYKRWLAISENFKEAK